MVPLYLDERFSFYLGLYCRDLYQYIGKSINPLGEFAELVEGCIGIQEIYVVPLYIEELSFFYPGLYCWGLYRDISVSINPLGEFAELAEGCKGIQVFCFMQCACSHSFFL